MQSVLSPKTGLLSQLWHRFHTCRFFGRTFPKASFKLDHVWISAGGEPYLLACQKLTLAPLVCHLIDNDRPPRDGLSGMEGSSRPSLRGRCLILLNRGRGFSD